MTYECDKMLNARDIPELAQFRPYSSYLAARLVQEESVVG